MVNAINFGATLAKYVPVEQHPQTNFKKGYERSSLTVQLEPGDKVPTPWEKSRTTDSPVDQIIFATAVFKEDPPPDTVFFDAIAVYQDGSSASINTLPPEFSEKLIDLIQKTKNLSDHTKAFFIKMYEEDLQRIKKGNRQSE